MTTKQTATNDKSHADKFKEAAREHGADEDEAAWDKRLKQVVEHKRVPKKAP